ncbi:SfnB family sulfur acquisition oxidoreductase [Streptomyces sp. NPDC002928]|uniref:SfnB family sulfur acquisition oxidoreductase n=1 Tax=Streptomyces sp. NPDC002928 TaxID=3154440 RepID=UPI0033A356CA
MTTTTYSVPRRIADDAEAVAAARALGTRLAEDGADARRDAERLLPREQVRQVSEAGLFTLTVPREHGGPQVSARTLGEVFTELSAGDSSVGQIPQNHYYFVDLLQHTGTAEQLAFFHAEVLAGRHFGNALSERGTATAKDYSISFRQQPDGSRVVDGTKYYATGSPFAHWIPIYANDEQGRLHAAWIPADHPGVTIEDDWKGMGQRTTGSGTVRFSSVTVPAEHVVEVDPMYEKPETFGAFGNYLHAAVDAGIAVAALRDGRRLIRELARPWWEAGVERAADEGAVIDRFGELALLVRAARALVREAGEAVDAARADLTERSAAEASAAVAAARAQADSAALTVASDIFALVGTRAADNALNLHRHWRNARTHTLHDPRRWKIRHLGAWELDEVPPPRNGII